ncbi:MAG: class I SAM-dependent methyltransferase [Longimicrobiales bacterium]
MRKAFAALAGDHEDRHSLLRAVCRPGVNFLKRFSITRAVYLQVVHPLLAERGCAGTDADGYLYTTGWLRSYVTGRPVTKSGSPLPWYTYPAIAFLSERVRPGMRVFEYGSGNSTLWWLSQGCDVVACEHDREWFEAVRRKTAGAAVLVFREPTDRRYVTEVTGHGLFDIVVIDGLHRVECAKACVPLLNDKGVVIFDNAEREEYWEGFRYLLDAGFRRLNLDGLAALNVFASCTSVFYRSSNCLGI